MISRITDERSLTEVTKSILGHHQLSPKNLMKTTKVCNLPGENVLPEKNMLDALLNDYIEKKIDKRIFMSQILAWSYNYLFLKGEYIPLHTPPKPQAVCAVEELSFADRKNLSQEALEGYKNIKNKWSSLCASIKSQNKTYLKWLRKIRKYYIYKNENDKVADLSKTIKLYERVCNGT